MESLHIEEPPTTTTTTTTTTTCLPAALRPSRTTLSFWLMGLLNNSAYVIMNAGAKDITPCLVGLVYIANVLPSLATKATLPFWQHRVNYTTRLAVATVLMFSSFVTVILGQVAASPALQLFGVALGSAQSGLGEASLLAMASFYGETSRIALTAWSSGTGFAGIFGYAYVILFTVGFQASFNTTLCVGLFLPVSYGWIFFQVLDRPRAAEEEEGFHQLVNTNTDSLHTASSSNAMPASVPSVLPKGRQAMATAIWNLWPYTVPLFTVYFAEYAMQSGTWAAIGFPVTDETSRKEFYKLANFFYQMGVFVSRSSGTVLHLTRNMLWIMPILQCLLLLFFWTDAAFMYWYDWSLLLPAFVTGLLGGLVYVGAFTLINSEVPAGKLREFSLSAASIADSIGIVCSDVLGLLIQLQLYSMHGLKDSGAECTGGGGGSGNAGNTTNVTLW
jgi:battenin